LLNPIEHDLIRAISNTEQAVRQTNVLNCKCRCILSVAKPHSYTEESRLERSSLPVDPET